MYVQTTLSWKAANRALQEKIHIILQMSPKLDIDVCGF